MNPYQLQWLEDYVLKSAAILAPEWRIVVDDAEENDHASVSFGADRTATISFNPAFFEEAEPDRRDTVAHEFIHLGLSDLMSAVDLFEQWVPPVMWGLMKGLLKDQEEKACGLLARALAEALPPCEPDNSG